MSLCFLPENSAAVATDRQVRATCGVWERLYLRPLTTQAQRGCEGAVGGCCLVKDFEAMKSMKQTHPPRRARKASPFPRRPLTYYFVWATLAFAIYLYTTWAKETPAGPPHHLEVEGKSAQGRGKAVWPLFFCPEASQATPQPLPPSPPFLTLPKFKKEWWVSFCDFPRLSSHRCPVTAFKIMI